MRRDARKTFLIDGKWCAAFTDIVFNGQDIASYATGLQALLNRTIARAFQRKKILLRCLNTVPSLKKCCTFKGFEHGVEIQTFFE